MQHFINLIKVVWARKPGLMEWRSMEDLLVSILKAENLTDTEKIALCKETIDAFTGRGYFPAQF